MLKLIQSVLLVLFEIICCKFFYENFGKVRYKGWINIVQLTLLLGSILFLSCSFFEYFLMRQFFGIFLFSVFMLWHVQISFKKSLVLAILFDALLLAVDYLIYLGSKLFGQQHEVGYIWVCLLAKIILFFLILIIRKWFGKKTMEMMSDTEWLRFLFFPIFTIVTISAMMSAFKSIQTIEQTNLLFIIAFGMIGMNMVVFYLINDVAKKEVQIQETKLLQIQGKNKLEMYKSISENYDN